MTVEDIHEHADADHVAVVKAEFRRRRGLSDKIDDAVRRAYDEPLTHRRVTVGIAKEVDTPNRQDQTRPAERGPNDKKYKRRDTEYADKWPNITVKGTPPADGPDFENETGKFEKYFSANPGEGS